MRELIGMEKEEIRLAKTHWKEENKNRILYRCYQLSDIAKLAELSDYANGLTNKKKK